MQYRQRIITDAVGTAMGLVSVMQGMGEELRGYRRSRKRGARSREESESLSVMREALAKECKRREELEERLRVLEERLGESPAEKKAKKPAQKAKRKEL